MSSLPLLIGLDLGTTYFKALAVDDEGRPRASASIPTPASDEGDGRVVYYPDAVWEAVCKLLHAVLRDIREPIVGIACSSMGEAGFLLDSRGRPLGPAIAWFDPRTQAVARSLQERAGKDRIRAITGLTPDFTYSLNKIVWIRQHHPDAFRQGRCWLGMADWVAYRLSGVAATDYTLASRTMAFDLRAETWSNELLELADVDASIFPAVRPSGTVLGDLTAQAASETGLPAQTAVCVGGHDHLCAALAVGAVNEGVLLNSCGTTETFLSALDVNGLERALPDVSIAVGHHLFPGLFYAMTTLRTSGLSVDWFVRHMLTSQQRSPAELGRQASSSPVGARGLLFYPYFRDASDDRHAAGSSAVLVGVRDYHTNADLARALLEGLGFEARRMLDRLSPLLSVRPTIVRAVGGSTRNATWMQIKADVTGVTLEACDITEASAYGAALLAGLGVGVFGDGGGTQQWPAVATRATFTPDPHRHSIYEVYYQRYQSLLPLVIQATAIAEAYSSAEGGESVGK